MLYCFNSSVLGPAEGIAAYHGVIWQIAICGEFLVAQAGVEVDSTTFPLAAMSAPIGAPFQHERAFALTD